MSQPYQPSIHGSRETALVAVGQRYAQALLLPFEVLQRQRWSAPWNTAQR